MPAQRLIGRWKQGPEYLWLPEEWPQDNSIADLNEVEKEHRKTQVILLRGSPEVIDCKKFQTGENLSQQAPMYLDSSGIYVPDIKQRNYPKPRTADAIEPRSIGAARTGESRDVLG